MADKQKEFNDQVLRALDEGSAILKQAFRNGEIEGFKVDKSLPEGTPSWEPDRLYIHHHLGLGDHIVCNGMVRYFLDQSESKKVGVFAKDNYFPLVQHMYRDDPRIQVIKINKNREFIEVATFLNNYNCDNYKIVGHQYFVDVPESVKLKKNCWEIFYELMGIPLDVRHNMFHLERDTTQEEELLKKLNPNGEPFVFIHDDMSRGHVIDLEKIDLPDGIKIIKNNSSFNLFHYLKIIEEAEEVHCMESSFKCLIDAWAGRSEKLYFHDIRTVPLGKSTLPWKIIKYI
tara:strand:+ start:7435 stop:8295 length:861 start_codon:yes stop_codon:yes gene_type:complete